MILFSLILDSYFLLLHSMGSLYGSRSLYEFFFGAGGVGIVGGGVVFTAVVVFSATIFSGAVFGGGETKELG